MGETRSSEFPMRSLILSIDQLSFDRVSLGLFFFARIIFEYMVHLLEGSALGFGYEEESPHCSEYAKYGEKDIGTVASILDERRSDKALKKESV